MARTNAPLPEDKEKMNRTYATVLIAGSTCLASMSAIAAPTIYAAKSASTTSTLHGGDRELLTLGFTGTSSAMTGADFLPLEQRQPDQQRRHLRLERSGSPA